LLFIIHFFPRVGVSLSRGLCWFILGVVMGVPRATYLLTCWSASPKQVWSWCLTAREPSCFLSVMWHGEALSRLGVWGVRVLFILGFFFCQVCLQYLSKIFDLQSSHSLLPPSSHHLGSSATVCDTFILESWWFNQKLRVICRTFKSIGTC
jgi:hypothetical protein